MKFNTTATPVSFSSAIAATRKKLTIEELRAWKHQNNSAGSGGGGETAGTSAAPPPARLFSKMVAGAVAVGGVGLGMNVLSPGGASFSGGVSDFGKKLYDPMECNGGGSESGNKYGNMFECMAIQLLEVKAAEDIGKFAAKTFM